MEKRLNELLEEAEATNERYSTSNMSAAEAYTALYDVLECIALLFQDQLKGGGYGI
jgi:hypothetical protein